MPQAYSMPPIARIDTMEMQGKSLTPAHFAQASQLMINAYGMGGRSFPLIVKDMVTPAAGWAQSVVPGLANGRDNGGRGA
jgi:hypothetical protein